MVGGGVQAGRGRPHRNRFPGADVTDENSEGGLGHAEVDAGDRFGMGIPGEEILGWDRLGERGLGEPEVGQRGLVSPPSTRRRDRRHPQRTRPIRRPPWSGSHAVNTGNRGWQLPMLLTVSGCFQTSRGQKADGVYWLPLPGSAGRRRDVEVIWRPPASGLAKGGRRPGKTLEASARGFPRRRSLAYASYLDL
jgi:hypothetical protein